VPLLRVLGGPAYVIGSVPLAIILTVNALVIVGGPMGSALQGTRKTLIFVLSTSIALISNLVLSVLLIPSLSLTGAAIGYSSVGTVSFVVIFAYAWKSGVVKLDIRMLSRIWLSAIVMSALVYLFATVTGFSGILIPFYVIAGLVTYLLMLKATSALSETDKELLKRLIPGELGLLKAFVELL
jgi:O-antigen/teichoic acid export membrane protein